MLWFFTPFLTPYERLALLWWWQRRQRQRAALKNRRRWWVRPIYSNRKTSSAYHLLIPRMIMLDPEIYSIFLRMTPAKFEELLRLVGPLIQKFSMGEPISPQEWLTATLRYLASGDSMKSIVYQFRTSSSTVFGIILETCNGIWTALKDVAFWPLSKRTFEKVADGFSLDFPNCIEAIVGKHVVCQAFPKSGSDFFNYKGTFSVVLLGVAIADYRFLVLDIGCPRRMSDGGVLRQSAFGKLLFSETLSVPPPKELPRTEDAIPYAFVADEAFPLTMSIMRPYPGKFLPDEEIIFNRMSRARMCIENSFGILSAKWRIYRRPILGQEKLVRAIIKSTVSLHNWLLKSDYELRPSQRTYLGPRVVDVFMADGDKIPGQWRAEVIDGGEAIRELRDVHLGSNRYARTAADVREKFTDYFIGPGQVDWQWRRLPNTDKFPN